jgi:hypothetical protein
MRTQEPIARAAGALIESTRLIVPILAYLYTLCADSHRLNVLLILAPPFPLMFSVYILSITRCWWPRIGAKFYRPTTWAC